MGGLRAIFDRGKAVADLDQNEFRGEQLPSFGSQLAFPLDGSFVPLVARVNERVDVSRVKEDRFSLVGHVRSGRGFRLDR